MKNLKNLLKTPLNLANLPKYIPILIIVFAFIGFADATYLTVKHYQNVIPPCTIGGCESVLSSVYAEVFGIPVALFGAVYYLIILLLTFISIDAKREIFLRIALLLSVIGLLSSIWFSFLQIFIIKAFCLYCALSAVTSVSIFIISLYVFKRCRYGEIENNLESNIY